MIAWHRFALERLMERFFGVKSQYEKWLTENRDTIIILDMMIKELDGCVFVLVLWERKGNL